MDRYKPTTGDVVTVQPPTNLTHHHGYRGLVFKIKYVGPFIIGTLLEFPENAELFADHKIGDEINWYASDWLILVKEKSANRPESKPEEQYFSPFTGKWS